MSFISALFSELALEKFKVFPEKYVCQSQLVIDPYINKDEDGIKSMDLLKYNENYSLLVYSPSFLKEVNSNLEKEYKNYLEIKSKLKVLYSATSQVLTIQVVYKNEQESIDLADTIIKKLCERGNKLFSYSKLSLLSQATVVNIISSSTTSNIIMLCIVFIIIYGTILTVYIYKKIREGIKLLGEVAEEIKEKFNRCWNMYD